MATAAVSARERLLEAARELFYNEGVQTVGIDRVIARAGVAKASLYNIFGSKEELVCAYLEDRHAQGISALRDAIERHEDPRDRLLAAFDAQAQLMTRPGFRGCPFAAACAEAPAGSPIHRAAADYRADLRALFRELAADAGAADPAQTAAQLHALYDGVALAGRLDGDPAIAPAVRAAAAGLLDTRG